MDPWLFILIPLLLIFMVPVIGIWAEAYYKYKTFDDPFELIMSAIVTAFGISISYGIYKLAF